VGSNDPNFEKNAADIIELYLYPSTYVALFRAND